MSSSICYRLSGEYLSIGSDKKIPQASLCLFQNKKNIKTLIFSIINLCKNLLKKKVEITSTNNRYNYI